MKKKKDTKITFIEQPIPSRYNQEMIQRESFCNFETITISNGQIQPSEFGDFWIGH